MAEAKALDPWAYMSILVKAAQEVGLEPEVGFRFMQAVTMGINAAQATAPPEKDGKPS